MSDLYISLIGLHILLQENRWTERGNIYRSLTDTCMWKLINNKNNNKSFIFPQISVTMTGIEFLRSDFTEYSVHEHTSVNSPGRGSVP